MYKEKQPNLLIGFIFVSIGLLCLVISLFPSSFQELLKFRFNNLNPITFITSTFVHADSLHLIANVVVYFLVGSIVFAITIKSKKETAFLKALLLLIFVMPLAYGIIFLNINQLILQLSFVSCGLSGVIGGLVGLVIPSLYCLSQHEPRLEMSWELFFLSSVCLTGSVMLFPYLSSIYDMVLFSIITLTGVLLIAIQIFKIMNAIKKGKTEEKVKTVVFLIIILFYVIFLSCLFPENIVESSGKVVNTFAHFFGVYFGLIIGFLVFRYEYRFVKAQQIVSRGIQKTIKSNYFKITFFALVFLLIWSLLPFFNIEEYSFSLTFQLSDSGNNLFSTMAATVATILGIFFSISIIVVQHAASNYTPSVLQGYKTDFRTWFVFFYYLAFLIFIIIIPLQNPTDINIANVTIILFIFSFLFLATQFIHIINMIDPRNIIKRSKERCIKDLKRVTGRLGLLIKQKEPKNKIEKIIVNSPLYPEFLFHQNTDKLLAKSEECVVQISDVILKAGQRQEMETCNVGLEAISEIVSSYVGIRKEDTTQDDKFLQNISVQLSAIFEIALKNKDIPLMLKIVSTVGEIGCSTTQIKSISSFGGNQPTAMVIVNIHALGKKASEKGFWDVLARTLLELKNVGMYSIHNTKSDNLASNKIFELGKIGVLNKDWFIVSHTFEALKEMLVIAIIKKIDINQEPSELFESIDRIAELTINIGLDQWAFTSLFPLMPENSIQRVAWAAFQTKNKKCPKIEAYYREEYSQEILSMLMNTIGKLIKLTTKKASGASLWVMIETAENIALSIMEEKSITKDWGKEIIFKLTDDLSTSYIQISNYLNENDIHSNQPSKICDSLTSIVLHAIDLDKIEIGLHGIEALKIMCSSIIEKDKFGYDSARCAGRIAVVGAYASHKGNNEIFHKSTELLIEFDDKYLTKSRNVHKKLHIKTMKNIYNEAEDEFMSLYGELLKKVNSDALEKFIQNYENKSKKTEKTE